MFGDMEGLGLGLPVPSELALGQGAAALPETAA
jgi:hypothetical protein